MAEMLIFRAILLVLCLMSCNCTERIRLEAKKLIRGKVVASGHSVSAKSLPHCIEYCNRRKKTCDGIIYNEVIEKCRLINKCAPAYQIDNTSRIVYYSRRPQIKTPGYLYDAKSDSCIGLIKSRVNYAEADGLCKKQNAHLAMISRKKVNQVASKLLLNSRLKWAWINDKNVAHDFTLKPHGLSGNEVLPQEVFSPKVIQWRNTSYRSCWGVNDQGYWGQFSCKNDTMVVLCQINQFST